MASQDNGPDMIDMVMLIIECDNYADRINEYNALQKASERALQEKIALMNKYPVNSY